MVRCAQRAILMTSVIASANIFPTYFLIGYHERVDGGVDSDVTDRRAEHMGGEPRVGCRVGVLFFECWCPS